MTALAGRIRRTGLTRVAIVGALGIIISTVFALSWPHNYDEGFNYLFYGQRGFRFIVDDYTYPNNHVLFSLIQATIPRWLVDSEPLFLRLPNVLISGGLLATLTALVRRTAAAAFAVGLVFAGPWSIIYFGVARGYQFGTLLVAVALLVVAVRPDARWTAPVAGLIMALAAWTVPTYAYGTPALAALWWLRRRRRDAAVFTGTFGALTLLAYLPVLDQVLSEQTMSFNAALPFSEYTRRMVLDELFFLPPLPALVLSALGGWALVAAVRRVGDSADDTGARWAAVLLGYAAVFLVVVELTSLLDAVSTPFFRNAAFASLFIPVGIWASPIGAHRVVRLTLAALLAWNAVLGWNLYRGVTDGSRIVSYAGTYIGQTPHLDTVLADEDLAELRCHWTDEWTCRLYEAHFQRLGVAVSRVDRIEATTCAVGLYPPQSGTGIELRYRDGTTGLVCFG